MDNKDINNVPNKSGYYRVDVTNGKETYTEKVEHKQKSNRELTDELLFLTGRLPIGFNNFMIGIDAIMTVTMIVLLILDVLQFRFNIMIYENLKYIDIRLELMLILLGILIIIKLKTTRDFLLYNEDCNEVKNILDRISSTSSSIDIFTKDTESYYYKYPEYIKQNYELVKSVFVEKKELSDRLDKVKNKVEQKLHDIDYVFGYKKAIKIMDYAMFSIHNMLTEYIVLNIRLVDYRGKETKSHTYKIYTLNDVDEIIEAYIKEDKFKE